ncbi:MAG: dTDP-4-dehydrorhamnose reductase [Proteobacteria bacterium]|nr:dTDP-4-dehydrorhamnose reductase [Pseudomonadota bacterium]
MRICVTGAQGQVVSALRRIAHREGVDFVTLARPEFDLAHPVGVEAHLAKLAPDIVVSAAAHTAVDQAESEPELAMAINAEGPRALAGACAALGLPIIHLSTDFVFDGTKTSPYRESDPTGPAGAYGRSKLAGEIAVAAANPRHVILRTAWVYSAEGRNFVRTMLRLGETREVLSVVSDQLGCPSHADDIAQAVLVAAHQIKDAPVGDARFGVFHVAGAGDTSWAGFAAAIFQQAILYGRRPVHVVPITAAEYPTPARRPANSRLDCSRFREIYGYAMPHWHDGLARCIEAIFTHTDHSPE